MPKIDEKVEDGQVYLRNSVHTIFCQTWIDVHTRIFIKAKREESNVIIQKSQK